MRCHEQCLKCTGSQQNECSKCRSFEYLHSENHRNPLLSATMTLKCVAKCPNGTYAQEQRCYSCNESCYEFGCRFFKNINGWNFNCINLDVLGQAPYLVFYIFTIGNICPFNPLSQDQGVVIDAVMQQRRRTTQNGFVFLHSHFLKPNVKSTV